MRKKRLHAATVILGSILALAIAFSQFLTPESVSTAKKVKTEQTENQAENETGTYISLPSFSLPAPVHVEVNLNPYFLFDIFFERDVDENHVEEDLFFADRFFETMFRVIISPNAP
ncbi:MAG: hypothetical protein WD824_21350 [Cyclobacteriaceae bacterium]